MAEYVVCEYGPCDQPPAPDRRKYCSEQHMRNENQRRYRERKREEERRSGPEVADKDGGSVKGSGYNTAPRKLANRRSDDAQERGGWVYDEMERLNLFTKLNRDDDTLTQTDVARMLDCDQSSVSKCFNRWRTKKLQEKYAAETDRSDGVPKEWQPPELTLDNIPDLVSHFARFRSTFFQDPKGNPYYMPEHQVGWLESLLEAIIRGGKQMILSPPRHGKTRLVSQVTAWLICCVNRNIRVIMVGGNQSIAELTVGALKNQLEDNEALIETFCGPGEKFKPRRSSGLSWTNSEFTIDNRTIPGIPDPTMIALGRQGKILSRSADLIMVDDVDDSDACHTEHSREKTRTWWGVNVMSRKEEDTAVFVIGSRQHPDDLYQQLLEDPGWSTIVETAHDEGACTVEPYKDSAGIWECGCQHGQEDIHEDGCIFDEHQDCVLWPDVRSFAWLAEKRNGAESGTTFPMVYQNEPSDDAMTTFTRELFDECRDRRELGEIPTQDDTGHQRPVRLIAGLDPSGAGFQAAFLWAFDPSTNERFAVDFDNKIGGGIRKARKQIQDWYFTYNVAFWVVEENMYHGAIFEDEMLREFTQGNGITIRPHRTGVNKWDEQMGVSKLADWMAKGKVHVPWGTPEARQKFIVYRKQCLKFSRDTKSRKGKSDVLMASWFPEETLQRWRREWLANQTERARQRRSRYPFEPMSDPFASTAA